MGVLQVCAHLVFTHTMLRAQILESGDLLGSPRFACTHPDHGMGKTTSTEKAAPTFDNLGYGGPTASSVQEDNYCITWHREIFRLHHRNPVTKARGLIVDWLKLTDNFLCPHLRSGDPAVISSIRKADCPDMSTHLDPRSCSTCISAFGKCATPDCGTEFCFYRRPNYFSDWEIRRGAPKCETKIPSCS